MFSLFLSRTFLDFRLAVCNSACCNSSSYNCFLSNQLCGWHLLKWLYRTLIIFINSALHKYKAVTFISNGEIAMQIVIAVLCIHAGTLDAHEFLSQMEYHAPRNVCIELLKQSLGIQFCSSLEAGLKVIV